MKAAIYYGVKDIRVEEVPVPECGDDDILVKSVRCGICGSDTGSYFIGGHVGGNAPGRGMGHETAGYIAAVGKNVEGLKVGDRVFVNPMRATKLAEADMMGGFGDYFLALGAKLNDNVYILPDELSYDAAALIEPFSVATHGKNVPGAKPGDHVVVYGVGTIGLLCVAGLIAQGIVPVVVVRNNKRRAMLEEMGAVVCNINETELFPFVAQHFGMGVARVGYPVPDVDIVIDCAGGVNIPQEFVQMAKPGSRLSIIAIAKEPRPIPSMVMSSEAVIMGSCNFNHEDIIEVMDNLVSGRVDANKFITHHFKLDDINEAMEVANAREAAIKVLIDIE